MWTPSLSGQRFGKAPSPRLVFRLLFGRAEAFRSAASLAPKWVFLKVGGLLQAGGVPLVFA